MNPADDIEKLVKKLRYRPSAEARNRILGNVIKALENNKEQNSANIQRNIWVIVAKSRVAQVAAVLIVLSAICLLVLSDKGEPEQHETTGLEVAVRAKTPSELVSAISLSMAFRDGDLRSVESQFDKAEKKVKPRLKERITIDQLICELEDCEKI
jgi:hypothetical protein